MLSSIFIFPSFCFCNFRLNSLVFFFFSQSDYPVLTIPWYFIFFSYNFYFHFCFSFYIWLDVAYFQLKKRVLIFVKFLEHEYTCWLSFILKQEDSWSFFLPCTFLKFRFNFQRQKLIFCIVQSERVKQESLFFSCQCCGELETVFLTPMFSLRS